MANGNGLEETSKNGYDIGFIKGYFYQMIVLIDLLQNTLGYAHRNLSLRAFYIDKESGTLRLG